MDIYFNKQEIFATWQIQPLYGAIDALLAPAPLKDLKTQTNSGRDGVEPYNIALRKFDKRDFTMSFSQTGESMKDLYTKQQTLYTFLKDGTIAISVPDIEVTFRVALKSFDKYSLDINRNIATFSLSFTEPNPTDRTYEALGTPAN